MPAYVGVDGAGVLHYLSDKAPDGVACETVQGFALPGFQNAHSHAFQYAMTGDAEIHPAGIEDDFWTWREAMYRCALSVDPSQPKRSLQCCTQRCFAMATHMWPSFITCITIRMASHIRILPKWASAWSPRRILQAYGSHWCRCSIRKEILVSHQQIGSEDLFRRQLTIILSCWTQVLKVSSSIGISVQLPAGRQPGRYNHYFQSSSKKSPVPYSCIGAEEGNSGTVLLIRARDRCNGCCRTSG